MTHRMTHRMTLRVRRLTAALVSLMTGGMLLAAVAAPGPARAADPSQSAAVRLTIEATGCDRCVISLASARQKPSGKLDDLWQAEPFRLVDGRMTVEVPREHITGLTIAVNAPWEGHLPYQTLVAMRYRGQDVGERVSRREARTARRATPCWAGTMAPEATLRLRVQKVRVQGHTGPVWGTRAWTRETADWLRPMRPAQRGVVGTQDLVFCQA